MLSISMNIIWLVMLNSALASTLCALSQRWRDVAMLTYEDKITAQSQVC